MPPDTSRSRGSRSSRTWPARAAAPAAASTPRTPWRWLWRCWASRRPATRRFRRKTRAGGVPLIVQRLLQANRFHGDAATADGKTWKEHANAATEPPGQDVVRPHGEPLRKTGGLVILRGNLAPDGCVLKMAGHERTFHRGPARVFEREEDAFAAVRDRRIRAGDVVVIRYEGPRGRPGMREMLGVTAALVGEGLGESVALLTDGRFSGAAVTPSI